MANYEERRAANDRSLNDAENYRQLWTPEEDDLLRETMEEPIADVAYVLGRTIFAVDQRRSIVRNNAARAFFSYERLKPQPSLTYGDTCPRCGLVHRGDC